MDPLALISSGKRAIPFFVTDAFTDKPFGEKSIFHSIQSERILVLNRFLPAGNPAAICPLSFDLSDELMQKVALEMNLSETAYVQPLDNREMTQEERDTFFRYITVLNSRLNLVFN